MDLVVRAGSGGGAKVRGRFRKRLLTSRCRLAALPDEGETRPSPHKRGEGISARLQGVRNYQRP